MSKQEIQKTESILRDFIFEMNILKMDSSKSKVDSLIAL
jgi:hypothetical protein